MEANNFTTSEQYQKIIRLYKTRENFLLAALEDSGIKSKFILNTSISQERLLSLDIGNSVVGVGAIRGESSSSSGALLDNDDDRGGKKDKLIGSCGYSEYCKEYLNFLDISRENLYDRSRWLVGLLIFQSCSSYILANNETLLTNHPSIIYFLTMLVGAGGNAGNQSAVRVIRGIALGDIHDRNYKKFLVREVGMALALSTLMGIAGFIRATLSSQTSAAECIAITLSLVLIVFVSVIFGAILPIILNLLDIDPANSSTSIQVLMDILGVLLTCLVSTLLLDTAAGIAFTGCLGSLI